MSSSRYFDEIKRAMGVLAERKETLFLGQSVKYPGQRAHQSFEKVPVWKRIELPICEDFSVGLCTGLALEGYIPILFIPRWDFLLIAANQIVNHLDKVPVVSGFRPKVIIRTAVGASKPLNPGPQHTQNYTEPFRAMLTTIPVVDLIHTDSILDNYIDVLDSDGSAIMVEHMERY